MAKYHSDTDSVPLREADIGFVPCSSGEAQAPEPGELRGSEPP